MITIIFIIMGGIFNAIMDVITHKFNQSIFSKIKNDKIIKFINPNISWKNKWKNDEPKNGELFFGSSTFLVMFTDLWHLSKFLMIISMTLAIISHNNICQIKMIECVIYYLSFTTTFTLFYDYILKIK